MNRTFLSVTAVAAIGVFVSNVAVCSSAHAQSWAPDRQYKEGPGVKLGELEVHPGIALRGGYDTNVFKADGKTGAGSAGQKIVGSGIMAVTPHVNIQTQSKQRAEGGESASAPITPPTIALRAGLSASYFYYFEDSAPRNLEVDTDIWVGILPERPVNFELSASYSRTTRPFTQGGTDTSNNAFARNGIRPGARVNFGSKSQVLTGYVGYVPEIDIYQGKDFEYLSKLGHDVTAGSAWKFLPNTALLYDASLRLDNYFDDFGDGGPSPILYSDTTAVKTRLGVNGAITPALSLRVMAGYAVGFYAEDELDEFEDVLAEVVLGYVIAKRHRLEGGYLRDVSASALSGWVRSDKASAKLSLALGDAASLEFEGAFSYLTYGRVVGVSATTNMLGSISQDGGFDRTDNRVDGAIRAEYRATNWLAFMADATVQGSFTDFEYAVLTATATPFPDPAGYVSFQVFGGVRAHY